jgi:ribosomal protein L16 Arg81 hydroxylase
MVKDLASLLAPVSETSFLHYFLQKQRLHIKSTDPIRAIPLLPWTTINELIESDTLPPDRLRVIRANVEILPAMFRYGDGTQRLRAGALRALLRQGVSLIINRIGDLVPQIGRLTDAIERRLGHLTWANCYFSFGRGSAFKAHWDHHDVLVLQIHGRKRWRSYGTPMPFPVEGNGPSEPFGSEVVWEGLVEPGDVLYLPRGEVHEATLDEPHSVHLTIGIQAPCGVDFLRWVAERSVWDTLARMDLTRLGDEAALRRHESELKERLHALIDGTSLSTYLEAEDAKRKPRPALSLGVVDALDTGTIIFPALRRRVSLLPESELESEVVIGGEPYQLSSAARRVLDLLITRNEMSFGDLVAAIGGVDGDRALREAVVELAKKGLAGLEVRPRP